MRNRFASGSALAALVAFAVGACGSPTVAPPAVVNTPPTIESIVAASERAEADQPIQVTAVVKDLESTLDRLTYTWSASPQSGTFGGTVSFNGNQVSNTWRPPKGQTTPNVYTITLTVSEAYTSAGQARQNVVSKSTTVHYDDSPAEVVYLATDFLVNKFGTFTVSPAEAVSNFSDNCPGKADELGDVQNNRANFHILSATFNPTTPTFNGDLTTGRVEGSCRFDDIPNGGGGQREFITGTCLLTTVYENFRWYLCTSNFNGPYSTGPASLGRVPGRPFTR